jgi:hypothetical protein
MSHSEPNFCFSRGFRVSWTLAFWFVDTCLTVAMVAGVVVGSWTRRREARIHQGEEVGNDRLGTASHEHYDGRHLW